MSVSISEIIAGASVHAVPLAGECAGYLVLAAADQAVAAPRRIGPEQVHLFDDGTVRVEGARAAAEADAEGDLRALLDSLLLQASSSTPALLRASRRAPGRGIAALVREIETALIPVNRSAAHRALARLERETERARHAGRLEAASAQNVARHDPMPKATVVAPPAPPVEAPKPEPRVEASVEPRVEASAEPPIAEVDDIPSLFAPPVALVDSIAASVESSPTSVESIAALAAEIETRPEPIVVRRSSRPPAPTRTPSPPPYPVVGRAVSPPPFPVREAQPTTPVLGTVIESYSDDEMDIEVVFDDELMDEELTGVLVRATPLEVSALSDVSQTPSDVSAQADSSETPDPTDPSPPVLEEEPSVAANTAAPPVAELSEPESTALLAEAAEMPPEIPHDVPPAPPEVLLEVTAQLPPVPIPEAPLEVVLEVTAQLPPAPIPEAPAEPFEAHGETLALALAVEPTVPEPTPAPRLAMPKPRPSDVEDLLDRMTHASDAGNDELRTSLKGMAGLEPTPPPPET